MLFRLRLFVLFVVLVLAFHTAPANAEWRKKLGTFRVGIASDDRAESVVRRLRPFRDALERALGMPVEIFAARSHAALIDAQVNGRVEYAVYSSGAFARAWLLCKCIEPIVAATNGEGSVGFHSILLTRKDGPASLSALKGKKIAIPGRNSASGFLIPQIALSREGVSIESGDFQLIEAGSSEAAAALLYDAKADAVFGWSSLKGDPQAGYSDGTLRLLAGNKGRSAGLDYRIVWQSELFPHGPHAIRSALDTEAKDIVSDFLENLYTGNPVAYDAIEPALAGGFVTVTLEDYRLAIDMIERLASGPSAGKR